MRMWLWLSVVMLTGSNEFSDMESDLGPMYLNLNFPAWLTTTIAQTSISMTQMSKLRFSHMAPSCWKKRLAFVIKLNEMFHGGARVTNDLWFLLSSQMKVTKRSPEKVVHIFRGLHRHSSSLLISGFLWLHSQFFHSTCN